MPLNPNEVYICDSCLATLPKYPHPRFPKRGEDIQVCSICEKLRLAWIVYRKNLPNTCETETKQ